MPKNIVIFCDGTWNSPSDEEFGVPSVTNVRTLYRACQDFSESGGAQVVWYQSGIGALGGKFRRAFEGATGWGIGGAIQRGYTAIASHYEPGDKIYLFGFSRGAFLARSIAGMIRQTGLLEDYSVASVKKAYKFYEETVFDYSEEKTYYYPKDAPLKDPNRGPGKVRVHFIGVWDTVGSLGFSFWGWSFNLRFFRNGFHDISPNAITDHVYHALAMDEIRTSFMPSLWDYPEEKTHKESAYTQNAEPCGHIEQAWFRGVHSDIGGGYAERGLSDVTLKWMVEKAMGHGLLLRENALLSDDDPTLTETEKREKATLAPRPASRIHRSYQGPLWTSVGGWPRWYPPLATTVEEGGHWGYLHASVKDREEICTRTGSAELKITPLAVGESKSVEIRADHLWNFSGFVLEAGGTYSLTAEGKWRDGNGATVGPDGETPEQSGIWSRWKLIKSVRRAPKQPWMKLIGVVNYPREWPWKERPWYEALPYIFWKDPQQLVNDLFAIGKQTSSPIVVKETGLLWVFANDLWRTYDNNTGSVTLTVTRTA